MEEFLHHQRRAAGAPGYGGPAGAAGGPAGILLLDGQYRAVPAEHGTGDDHPFLIALRESLRGFLDQRPQRSERWTVSRSEPARRFRAAPPPEQVPDPTGAGEYVRTSVRKENYGSPRWTVESEYEGRRWGLVEWSRTVVSNPSSSTAMETRRTGMVYLYGNGLVCPGIGADDPSAVRQPEDLTSRWLLQVTGEHGHLWGPWHTCNSIVARLRKYLGQ